MTKDTAFIEGRAKLRMILELSGYQCGQYIGPVGAHAIGYRVNGTPTILAPLASSAPSPMRNACVQQMVWKLVGAVCQADSSTPSAATDGNGSSLPILAIPISGEVASGLREMLAYQAVRGP